MSRRTDRACLICELVVKRVFDFICQYQYDLATDSVERDLHAQRGGFCALHTWQYMQIASSNGLCAGYSEPLQEIGERLLAIVAEATSIDELIVELKKFPVARPSCGACEVAAKAEEEALEGALTNLIVATATNDTIPFLCFTHLIALASRCPDSGAVRLLLEQHGEEFKRVADDMQQYNVKHGALQRYLITDRERAAPLRGLMLLAGHTEHIP
jgi:hypothetical protein